MKRKQPLPRLTHESLEVRTVLSSNSVAGAGIIASQPDVANVISNATDLGTVSAADDLEFSGEITRGTEVDWYRFTLDRPSAVHLSSSFGVVGLYNSAGYDRNDPQVLETHRLLNQASSAGVSNASIARQLAAGTYYVAVSGLGNSDFASTLADSGLAGAVGEYHLQFSVSDVVATSGSNPLVLAIDASALIVRLDLSQDIGFQAVVSLTNDQGQEIAIASTNLNHSIFELQVVPGQVLTARAYTVVVADQSGVARLTSSFVIASGNGAEIGSAGNDTPATASELGELQGSLRITGTVGDDPFYLNHPGGIAPQAGNDVDMYHFSVTSETPISVQIEGFAGRINSRLNIGLALYRLNSETGALDFVAANNNTANTTRSSDGNQILLYDAFVATQLTQGEYYLVVSDGSNLYSPLDGQVDAGQFEYYDPSVAHSGTAGQTTGDYVVHLKEIPTPPAPQVVAVSIAPQSVLAESPTTFTVQFDQFTNLAQLANFAFNSQGNSQLSSVTIQDAAGHSFSPRLVSFDSDTFTATFSLLDRLPSGNFQLHLSGSQGLGNLVGVPLTGNSAGGDYVVEFSVNTTAAGTAGNPLVWTHQAETSTGETPQSLGVLFPNELQQGVIIQRGPLTSLQQVRDTLDEYQFTVLQDQTYTFSVSGLKLPPGLKLTLLDAQHQPINVAGTSDGQLILAQLKAGTYSLQVGNWPGPLAKTVAYQIKATIIAIKDNPPPLYIGPGPAIGMRLVNAGDTPTTGGGTSLGSTGSGGGLGGSKSPGGIAIGGTANSTGGSQLTANNSTNSLPSSAGSSYLSARLNQLRSPLQSNTDGVVIAIPTVSTNLAEGGSRLSQGTRITRRASSTSEDLSFDMLSSLADGLIDQKNSPSRQLAPSLKSMGRLRSLIETLSDHDSEDVDQRKKPQNDQDGEPLDNTTAQLRDVRNYVPETVSEVSFQEESQEPLNLQTNLNLGEDTRLLEAAAGAEAAGTGDELLMAGEPLATDSPMTSGDDKSNWETAPDTLFAAGLAMLIIDSAFSGKETAAASVEPSSPGNRRKTLARRDS